MPLTLGTNIASFKSQRQLNQTARKLDGVFERLSSGQRINRASDDAASLAIADTLKVTSRVQAQAVRNLNDGVSLLNIADSALENLTSIVIRLEELAEQASNGSLGYAQRVSLDDEGQALSREFNRIVQSTQFNDIRVLNGDLDELALQAGIGVNAILQEGIGGAVGSGNFDTPFTSSVGTATLDTKFADVNGDGVLDMISGGSSSLRIAFGDGSGDFVLSQNFTGTTFIEVDIADLNGDGQLDIYASGATNITYLNDGSGNFTAGPTTTLANALTNENLADVNQDGIIDLVGIDNANDLITVALGIGDGSFSSSLITTTATNAAGEFIVGDFNNDGSLDAVAEVAGGFTFFNGNGDGTFVEGDTVALSNIFLLQSGDFNGDGVLDVTALLTNDMIATTLGQGDGTFGEVSNADPGFQVSGRDIRVGDFNGDGLDDVVAVSSDGSESAASVMLSDGSGSFSLSYSYSVDDPYAQLVTGDLNQDGVTDFIAGGDNDALVFLADTVGGTSAIQSFSLANQGDALQALSILSNKRELLTAQRGEIGAFLSRIEAANNVVSASAENLKAAEARIRDADIAFETANLTRLSILQEAATAVLGQANLQPSLALSLLES